MSKKMNDVEQLTFKLEQVKSQLQGEITDRKKAEEEAQRREVQARLVHEVSQRVSSELELEELFFAVVNAIADSFGYYSVVIATVDEEKRHLVMRAAAGGFMDIFPPGGYVPLGEGMTGRTAVTGETQLSGDVSQNPYYRRYREEETHSELVVPIKSGDKIIGVLDLQSEEFNAFDQTDAMVMQTLADQVGVAMDNARLFQQAQLEISERKRADTELRKHQEHLEERVDERTAELRASEERYRSLFDGIPIGLYRTTPEGRVLDANLALVDLYRYPHREDLLVTDLTSTYVEPEERERWKKLMESKGMVRDFEACIKRFDGTTIWVNDTARAVKDEQGKVQYYEGSFEDITDRKLAQKQLLQYQEQLEELVEDRTAELKASEERYHTLFDGVPISLYRTTPEGNVMDSNQAMVEMFGYPNREEAFEISATEVYVNIEDRIRWQKLMENEGVVRDFEAQVRRYDNEIIWISDTARAVKDDQGQILYYEGSLEDITERKQYEEEIRRQKDYFESLFINSPVAILTADLDAKVVSWNPKAEQLFGYCQDEVVGKHVDDLVATDPIIRDEAQYLTKQIDEMGRVQATTKRTRKDGSLVDVELLALPLVLAGEKVGFYAMYHNISELKRIERELRQQKDYFESVFINSPVAIMTSDLEANVVSWNPKAEKMFGYTAEEAIGKQIDDLVATDSGIREEALAYTQELITTDRVQATAKRTRKDGSMVDVEILVLPTIIAEEKVGYIGIYYDISELLQARREAEAANQAKSTFLANMSHELRTPLNAILGFTQLMDGDPNLTPGQQENLGIINQSGEHLLALINDVLEMSKIEAGQVRLREKSFDLLYLLDSLEEMFRLQAENKGLDLVFEIAENIPRYVTSDESKLRQVLNNLIGNAVKFTEEVGVHIKVSALPSNGEKMELNLEVIDTGPGIPPEDLEAVFDPFVQAADMTDFMSTQAPEGTGLGLSISRKFVRLMGGEITAKSELGVGSKFSFSVIIGLAEAQELPSEQTKQEVLRLEPNQPVHRLLVVEDRETNRRLLVKLLEQLGFEVQEAADGHEAIDAWQRWEPHLIWMDMRMPVMNGREATRRIKAMPGGDAVSIIALTATAFDEDRESILLDGCDDFVRKPFRKKEITDILIKHLNVRFEYKDKTLPITEDFEIEPAKKSPDIQALLALPDEWVEELCLATKRADLHRILEQSDQIREQYPELARVLKDLAESYAYESILKLIETSRGVIDE
jgi:PAS domain S-box-containing protein